MVVDACDPSTQHTEGHQFKFLHSYLVNVRPVQETWDLILK